MMKDVDTPHVTPIKGYAADAGKVRLTSPQASPMRRVSCPIKAAQFRPRNIATPLTSSSPPFPPYPQRKRSLDGTPDASPPEVIALETLAVIDHSCKVPDHFFKAGPGFKGEVGGSIRVDEETLQTMLVNVGEFSTKAGGSAANTARGLAAGFDIRTSLISAVGKDEWGALFTSSMRRAGVDASKTVVRDDPEARTGRCVCLVDKTGQRTMRPSFDDKHRLLPNEITPDMFEGSRWVVVNGYSYYSPGFLEAACDAASIAGCKVAMHLASFEIVRKFRPHLTSLLASGKVHVVFANEDEARELVGGGDASSESIETDTKIEAALAKLAEWCDIAVVTLGDKGCVAMRGTERVEQKAFKGFDVKDTTGAGDLFSAGFMYGLLRNASLQRCCELGCLSGAAVVQSMGAEISEEGWTWVHAHMHEGRAQALVRGSAAAVQRELLACYELIESIGRGVVYYGSARLKADNPHFVKSRELGKMVSELLGTPTWTGGGPGMMEAASLGAMDAGKAVAGIRIEREAGTKVRSAAQSYLKPEHTVFCKFLSPRKVALVDAGVRKKAEDRTAYVFLPGGLGTMDELFELFTLYQLHKLGTDHPVPVIIVNYDGFYDCLLNFVETMQGHGTVGAGEYDQMVVKNTNEEVVEYLREYYQI